MLFLCCVFLLSFLSYLSCLSCLVSDLVSDLSELRAHVHAGAIWLKSVVFVVAAPP